MLFRELAGKGRSIDTQMMNSARIKAHRSAAGGKGRRQKQAIGRSRGGRTQIHALADARGRLIAILLTGGQAQFPLREKTLIRRVKPSKRMLGDAAYDSGELREQLDERGTEPVIPNRCKNCRSPSTSTCTSCAGYRGCLQQVERL